MRCLIGLVALTAAWGSPAAVVREFTHFSQLMRANRGYRAILPPAYQASPKRYPVIYWFYGYEQGNDERNRQLADYVAAHNVIVVSAGPVETVGQFPLYFPELVEQADKTLRTIADRNHRAATGFGAGGFMALWVAGKYPDLVASASSLAGPTEAPVGPPGFDTPFCLDDFYGNYDGVRTRLVTGNSDPLRFYHHRLNALWTFAAAHHQTESPAAENGAPAIAATLDFHLRAFADPLPKPAVFSHADAYPNFTVWGWEVGSDRRQPGVTVLDNVSAAGFRSAVREWMRGGAALPAVKLSMASAPLYVPRSRHAVTYIRLKDGKVRRATERADARGRLSFELTGDAYEVSVSAGPAIAVAGYEITGAAWATAGQPVRLRVKFLNKGAARSGESPLRWESPNPGVHLVPTGNRLFSLAPGESLGVPMTFTVDEADRAVVGIVAVVGATRMPFEVPLFPPAQPASDFQIADGRTLTVFQHAVERAAVTLGEGNGDGFASPGESFAVLLPDGDGLRAAQVFTNDPCVDNTVRAPDSWDPYDHAGASVWRSLPSIRQDCEPGGLVHLLLRVVVPKAPDHHVEYRTVEFPVWWRKPEDAPKK